MIISRTTPYFYFLEYFFETEVIYFIEHSLQIIMLESLILTDC